jgi:hypothetical protein
MDCPRCGATAVTSPECPSCGVLVAKARPSHARPVKAPPPPAPAWRSLLLPGIGLALVAGAAVVHLRSAPPGEDRGAVAGAHPAGEAAPPVVEPGEPPLPERTPPPAPETLVLPPAQATDPQAAADRAAADRLLARLRARKRLDAEDLRAAESLYERHRDPARHLLEAVLLSRAASERDQRRFDAAEALVERAVDVAPASAASRGALLDVRLQQGDWRGAELAGRALLALDPADAIGVRGLATALLRQDRTGEAVELLAAFLERRPDAETQTLLERIRRDQSTERTLEEAKLAHFHVRFDGEAHEEVGREILRLLERHYASLARTFDYQPQQPVPVILLSNESYYNATGAPAWSGGLYDAFDGRVRIPIGGLDTSLAAELDSTLVHELTHSFVADLSRGSAPRELHEGLAQYMEGRRLTQLDAPRLRALADGELQGVSGFYLGALGLVEELMAQRGQGGINDLLRALGTTGVDEAFRSVYGRDFATLRRDAAARLRQRHGS